MSFVSLRHNKECNCKYFWYYLKICLEKFGNIAALEKICLRAIWKKFSRIKLIYSFSYSTIDKICFLFHS